MAVGRREGGKREAKGYHDRTYDFVRTIQRLTFAIPPFPHSVALRRSSLCLPAATGIDNHGVARNEAAVSIEYGGKDDQR